MTQRVANKRIFSDDESVEDKTMDMQIEYSEYMARQVKEDNKRRKEAEAAEKSKEDHSSLYTKSDVYLLDPDSETSRCGFQWVQSPYRCYMKMGPFQRVNDKLEAVPKQGHAYLSMEDCLNLSKNLSLMFKVFKETREEHKNRVEQIVMKMQEQQDPFKIMMAAARSSNKNNIGQRRYFK